MTDVPRPEYPRPQFTRRRWSSLNGAWSFAVDDADVGRRERWFARTLQQLTRDGPFERSITVPFAFQSELSGIHDTSRHDVVWYARAFRDVREDVDERLLLHFGAVDYRTTVWVNGHVVAEHEGGHTPFSADVSDVLGADDNVVVVRAEDPLDDLGIPRGKQYWREQSERIFYTATTGIWQSVWLEPVARRRISDLVITPDFDAGAVDLTVDTVGAVPGDVLRVLVTIGDVVLADDHVRVTGARLQRTISVVPPPGHQGGHVADAQGMAVWSPEHPHLHDVRLELGPAEGTPSDTVASYFGMRKIDVRGDRVLLNGRPYEQRLVLDQGYFPGGNLTAARDDDLRSDIVLAKQLGFNGARKHQKIEDPRWLYWADRLGFLVWEEMPSAYTHSPATLGRVSSEWQQVVARDRNHPCVVAWVPMNESWGVSRLGSDQAERSYLRALYHLTKALDPDRLVISNDGWEHATTDLCTIHDYADAGTVAARYQQLGTEVDVTPAGRPLYVPGHGYRGEPILITEFGGIALADGEQTWGYHSAADSKELLTRYRDLVAAIVASPRVDGFCYTQLTDVEQEANGLLTFDRKPKADVDSLHQATTQHRP